MNPFKKYLIKVKGRSVIMKHFTDIEKDEIKQAVFKVSDAYWSLKGILDKAGPGNSGDFTRMVSDLKEIVDDPGGSVGYFTSIL